MPPIFRRWFAARRTRWVLAAVLSLALVSAQTLAARHELSHLFGNTAGELVAASGEPAGSAGHPAAVQAGHECSLCLLAAALGGTAAGPQGLQFALAEPVAQGPLAPALAWAPRFLRAYASRAPPLA